MIGRHAGVLVLCGLLAAAAGWRQQGVTSPSPRTVPEESRQVVLDGEAKAVLHLSFLVSGPMIDASSQVSCRVASVMAFTTVDDRVQYDLVHACPALPLAGRQEIQFLIGFDNGGRSADYRVQLAPAQQLTWQSLRDVDDLEVRTTRL